MVIKICDYLLDLIVEITSHYAIINLKNYNYLGYKQKTATSFPKFLGIQRIVRLAN